MDDRLAANRANWNDRTPVHLASDFYDVDGWLRDGRGPRADELEALGDVTGLRLVHLQCHFGLDTLAWARAGAHVTGVDFSPVAIEAARTLAVKAGLTDRSAFVCAEVGDAHEALGDSRFDVVYVSLGSLCWLPDVDAWAAQVGGLLEPAGRAYVHDDHPLANALAYSRAAEPLMLVRSYFEESEPGVDDATGTYTDGATEFAHTRIFQWNHSIGEIVTTLVRSGLRLDRLTEHDWTDWPRFPWLEARAPGRWTLPDSHPRVPLSFSLLASRPPGDTG